MARLGDLFSNKAIQDNKVGHWLSRGDWLALPNELRSEFRKQFVGNVTRGYYFISTRKRFEELRDMANKVLDFAQA